ncbi:MAG: glucose-1-phosphate adenylyltransferase [Moheibacter sp.]
MKPKVLAVILGGGQGTRLYPLTESRSKPAVPIGGKYRLVDIPISNCLNSGINRILVLTQFNSASLNSHIKNAYHFDIFSKGFVEILAADQDFDNKSWYQGTADAVRKSQKHLNKFDYDYLMILSGDQLYQMDFNNLIDFHIKTQSEISIATIPVDKYDATGFGILKADNNFLITSFIEKPKAEVLPEWKSEVSEQNKLLGKEYLASMGIYVFNRDTLNRIFNEDEGNDFGKELIPKAIHKYKTSSFQYSGYWTDIGTIRSFFDANMDLTRDIPQFNMYGPNKVYTNSRMLPPNKITGTRIDHVIFGGGCIVSADTIESSVIGVRSRIDTGTVIKNVYMMGADYFSKTKDFEDFIQYGKPLLGIGENSHIENAILDKNCRIGKNVIIKGSTDLPDGDSETHTISDGIVIVKKYALIEDGTVIS